MDVHEGEVLVLVGPSGCGKSTTLRLINRLIEPTSGRIFLKGEDVTDIDSSELRRRSGYVIPAGWPISHRTIAENIATVPKLLGWDKARRLLIELTRCLNSFPWILPCIATAIPRSFPGTGPAGWGCQSTCG